MCEERERERERETERQKERDRERETERETERGGERKQKENEKERETDWRDTQIQMNKFTTLQIMNKYNGEFVVCEFHKKIVY